MTKTKKSKNVEQQPAKKWKSLLREAETHYGNENVSCYRRTKIIREFFSDPDFRGDLQLADDFRAWEWLDRKFPSVLDCATLDMILTEFPHEQQWRENTLTKLWNQIRPEKPKKTKQKRNVVTRADLEEAKKDAEHQKSRADNALATLRRREAENEAMHKRLEGFESQGRLEGLLCEFVFSVEDILYDTPTYEESSGQALMIQISADTVHKLRKACIQARSRITIPEHAHV